MTTNPSVTTTLNGNDFVVVRKSQDFDYRVMPYNDFVQQISSDIGESGLSNQYVSMAGNTTLDLNDISLNSWVKIVVASTGLTLTVNLPLPTFAVNGQEVLITNVTSNSVLLNLDGFGAQIVGISSSIAAGASTTIKYDKTLNAWYKVN
jgi:hypothetical protein